MMAGLRSTRCGLHRICRRRGFLSLCPNQHLRAFHPFM
ncbi:hypothetical protein KIS1582_2506 [Cytobacillus firmus]|uniref:Uncharacterized protein n=1 Tax=Cytobacillus firmus TaxID=1399 RepID=A0A800NA96_CYTFI|nr:hypothetical protein KIS1582_2506 [Cytobacillus firmus]